MGFVPPRFIPPQMEAEITESQQPHEAWNQALQEDMLRPYSPPKPEYEDMLFAPADWQKQEVTGDD